MYTSVKVMGKTLPQVQKNPYFYTIIHTFSQLWEGLKILLEFWAYILKTSYKMKQDTYFKT